MQWYFNHLRRLRLVNRASRPLLAAGTTANEALHSEINRWFRNQSEIFHTTVILQLDAAMLGKQLAHDSAVARPTLCQQRHQEQLHGVVGLLRHDQEDWLSFCGVQYLDGKVCTFVRHDHD